MMPRSVADCHKYERLLDCAGTPHIRSAFAGASAKSNELNTAASHRNLQSEGKI
jgi:hypothetical protein